MHVVNFLDVTFDLNNGKFNDLTEMLNNAGISRSPN